jgi:ABC-2 type transport system ATP-binding protein
MEKAHQYAAVADEPTEAGVACHGLTKDFGQLRVLHDLSFTAPMGTVTGFVGANGAGKTTTLRIVLGLVQPTSGEALVAGKRYAQLERPRHAVGAILDGPGGHPGQTGRAYLRILAAAAGVPDSRVAEVLQLVELSHAAGRRIGGYSLGMRQRLALAGALLADPPILVLDEPANGLDPLGIRWIRGFLRDLADEGRCVLVSSHQLSELEATVDRIVMIHKGRLIADRAIDDSPVDIDREVKVRTPNPARLIELIEPLGAHASPISDQELVITGLSAERIGEVAATNAVVLHSLMESRSGLEELFLRLADDNTQVETADANRGER